MKKNIIFLVSGDSNSKSLASMFLSQFPRDSFYYAEDQSMSVRKIWNLIKNKRINIFWLFKQAYAAQRQRTHLKKTPIQTTLVQPDIAIQKHTELLEFIENNSDIEIIFAFRAGVILQKSLISKVRCINTHYASLPHYGGLGAISSALHDKAYDQSATIHEMETTIDSGAILLEEPYSLDPKVPYWRNELNAALAGVRAAEKYIKQNVLADHHDT